MQPNRFSVRPVHGRILIRILLACLPGLASAASFSLSPGSISNSYPGNITLQIAGLTNGETVLVERFLDLNANGVLDAGEPLVESFRLTDGQVTAIGGVRNANIPGDDDLTANSQITAAFNFSRGPEFTRASGSQIFRVSSPGGRFSPLQQVLSITQASYAQQIIGTVSNSTSVLPYSLAAVLVQVGSDSQFVAGTVADVSGNFSLGVPGGTYQVIAFQPGYVGSFATSPMVTVSGANTNVGVLLSPAAYTLSGSVTEAASGSGVPGSQFFVTSGNNEYCVTFSDALGNFSASVIPGQWKLEPSDSSAAIGGYFRPNNKVKATVTTANVSGVSVSVTRGTAMIYGTVKDSLNHPFPGVRLSCGDNANLYQSAAYTDNSGNYFLAVTNGTWYLGGSGSVSGLPNGYILQQAQVFLADGQAVLTNLVAVQATAYLAGRAVDSNGNPIGGGTMLGFLNNNNNAADVPIANDGTFAVPVWGGAWTLSLENQAAASHNVVSPQLSFVVTDGVSVSNINFVAPISTRSISGWVRNGTNGALSGLNVFAGAMINGTSYNAGATTDTGGNYSLPVLAGTWNVGVDSQGLQQLGYGQAANQNANTSSGNQTVNFLVGGPAVGTLFFRHSLGVVGEFGAASTPAINYPVTIKNFRAIFHVFNDPTPPTADTVLFTGPPGSGLTNTPADLNFGAVQDGTNVYYFSPPVRNPNTAMGGSWTVFYRSNPNNLNVQDPQAFSRIAVPVPTVTVTGGVLRSLNWTYRDQSGSPIFGTPLFIRTNRVDLFDQNGNQIYADVFPASFSYSFPPSGQYPWSDLSLVRVSYYDDMTNQYFVGFSESYPSLSGAGIVSGHTYQFQLNGPPTQNYTVQFRTNLSLGAWATLLITNSPTSPIAIIDPAATNGSRFYRVLVGP